MTELKPCGACGITGIHACMGPPIVTNDLMLIQTLTKRIAELEALLKKFLPMDEEGGGWDFQYNEGSEYLGKAVMEVLKEQG